MTVLSGAQSQLFLLFCLADGSCCWDACSVPLGAAGLREGCLVLVIESLPVDGKGRPARFRFWSRLLQDPASIRSSLGQSSAPGVAPLLWTGSPGKVQPVRCKGFSLGWLLLTQVGQQQVPGVWLGEGLLSPVPKPSMKLRRMGYKTSVWLRHP